MLESYWNIYENKLWIFDMESAGEIVGYNLVIG